MSAARTGDVESVTECLRAGTPVDGRHLNRSALDVAAQLGHVAVVRVLLAAGADMLQVAGTYHEVTPLLAALRRGQLEAVRVLLEAGAPTGYQGRMQQVPLHVAASIGREGDLAMVELLLAHGAEIDDGTAGATALEYAARAGLPSMVDLLIRRGATFTPQSVSWALEGRRGDAARCGRPEQVLELLHAAGVDEVTVIDRRRGPARDKWPFGTVPRPEGPRPSVRRSAPQDVRRRAEETPTGAPRPATPTPRHRPPSVGDG